MRMMHLQKTRYGNTNAIIHERKRKLNGDIMIKAMFECKGEFNNLFPNKIYICRSILQFTDVFIIYIFET